MIQGVVLETENSKGGSGAPNCGVNLIDLCLGKLFAKPFEALNPPAALSGDAPSQIGDGDRFTVFQLLEEIRKPVARGKFNRID